MRQLQPWHADLRKRQVKMPKVYIRDSGLLHTLLALDSQAALERHPKCGASWEGFILDQVLTLLDLPEERVYFWRAHTGAELDLLVDRGDHRVGYEIKRTSSPRLTPSMRSALRDLELAELTVIHAGDRSFPMADNVRAVAAVGCCTMCKAGHQIASQSRGLAGPPRRQCRRTRLPDSRGRRCCGLPTLGDLETQWLRRAP